MKKIVVWALGACFLLSSCVSTGQGAYTGGSFGTILGSAIGGLLGGPRGSDIGTIVGMAGGAAAGAAIGHSAEKQEVREHYQRVQDNKARNYNPYDDMQITGQSLTDGSQGISQSLTDDTTQSGFDPNNGGDDRLFDFTINAADSVATVEAETPSIDIRNVHYEDANGDGMLNGGEIAKVSFEVINTGKLPLNNVEPTVVETTGNKRIMVSPGISVDRIMPGQGIRYTAMIQASTRLKEGVATFLPKVSQNGALLKEASSLNITTQR